MGKEKVVRKGEYKTKSTVKKAHQNIPEKRFKREKNVKVAQKKNDFRAQKEQKAAKEEAEREIAKREKEERITKYKKKRLEKTKAISKKTQRGQPLMKDRMQLLLKQIQEMKRN